MMKILVCRVWTRGNITAFVVNFHCATNAHFHEENDEIPGWKEAGKFVAYACALLERSLRARHTVLSACCRRRKLMLSQFLVFRLFIFTSLQNRRISGTLLPLHATCASRLPRFCLCLPEIRKNYNCSAGYIFTVSFTKEHAYFEPACLLYMHESSLLTYLHHQFFTISVLVTVIVNCTAGETLIPLPNKTAFFISLV